MTSLLDAGVLRSVAALTGVMTDLATLGVSLLPMIFIGVVLFWLMLFTMNSFDKKQGTSNLNDRVQCIGTVLVVIMVAVGLWMGLNNININSVQVAMVLGPLVAAYALNFLVSGFFQWIWLVLTGTIRTGRRVHVGKDEGVIEHIGVLHVIIDVTSDGPLRRCVPIGVFINTIFDFIQE